MPFIIRHKRDKENFVISWGEITQDINKARIFKRRCDAGNSMNEQGLKREDWEAIPVALSELVEKKEPKKISLSILLFDGIWLYGECEKYFIDFQKVGGPMLLRLYNDNKLTNQYANVAAVDIKN
jgi:hypothetical protein